MNPIRSAFARLAATAVLALLPLAFAGAQDDTPIASPATQAVAIENPLRTPHDTVDLFLATLRKAESTRDPNARADLHTLAMDCLNLGTMDMDTRAAKGPDYVVQLLRHPECAHRRGLPGSQRHRGLARRTDGQG